MEKVFISGLCFIFLNNREGSPSQIKETENQNLLLVIHFYNLPPQLCQVLKLFYSFPFALLLGIPRNHGVPSHVIVVLRTACYMTHDIRGA